MNTPEVFILVGGFGTRLKKVVSDRPKPMAEINDKPFLEHLVNWLVDQKLQNITLLTYFDSDKITSHFGDGSELNARIQYVQEPQALGTGGALVHALSKISSEGPFLLLNGDSFFDVDLQSFISNSDATDLSLALSFQTDCSRYGVVDFDQDQNLISFKEKNPETKNSYINGGIYYFGSKEVLAGFAPLEKQSIETEIIPALQEKELKIKVQKYEDYFIDIGLPESYQAFIDYMSEKKS